jgi:hypothetical protein
MIFANPSVMYPRYNSLSSNLPSGSYTGNYSNASQNQQNNTIAINVYPQQGQNEEAIGEAVALKLGNILDNYVMVT